MPPTSAQSPAPHTVAAILQGSAYVLSIFSDEEIATVDLYDRKSKP